MKFKEFFAAAPKDIADSGKITEEMLFENVTGVNIASMKSFVAWLVLHEHLPAFIKDKKSGKSLPLAKIPPRKKVLILTKTLPNIRQLAEEFSSKFETKDYLLD